jgi:RHS repeat-associated protein
LVDYAYGFVKEVRRADSGANEVYWMADDYASDGRIEGEYFGNGLANQRYYSRATGRLIYASIDTGSITAAPYAIQQLAYTYDAVGNVKTRYDASTGRDERFATAGSSDNSDGYDGLDRLLVHRVVAGAPATTTTVSYNQQGNITAKSDVGSYAYAYTTGSGRALPHAVSSAGANSYTYDENGNMTGGAGRALSWTSFNQLLTATQGSYTSTFAFGAAHERVKQTSHLGTTVYIGGVFEKVTNGTAWEEKCYIMAPTGRVAVYTERSNATMETRYFHSDGLGSITTVTDEIGRVVKRFAFDVWGKRVDPSTNATIVAATNTEAGSSTSGKFTRGYTDHEHLDDLGLIHMNGRVYDPVLGRFLSADPFVGDEYDSQDFNRYSYVGNNPLNATDPSGYFSLKDGLKIVAVVAIAVVSAGAGVALLGASSAYGGALMCATGWSTAVVNGIAGGLVGGFASGFAGSLLNGGNVGDAFKAGAIGAIAGAVTGGLAGKIGDAFGSIGERGLGGEFGRAVSHGAVSGAAAEAQGGEFRHGFYAGFAGSVGGSATDGMGGDSLGAVAARTSVAAALAGTASALGGGKFANAAVTAAFQHLFNAEAHSSWDNAGDRALTAASNFFAGFGDGASFGLTAKFRQWMGYDDVVDRDSIIYSGGKVMGVVASSATGGVGSLSAGAKSVFYSGEGALAAARAGKGVGILMEKTLGGRVLNGANTVLRAVGGKMPQRVWDNASAIYAANAKGAAQVYLRQPMDSAGVWTRIERPMLKAWGNTKQISK